MTLAEFLLARFTEDEKLYRDWKSRSAVWAEPGGSWSCECGWDVHDDLPADRLLADIEAKRRIVKLHSGAASWCAWSQDNMSTHDSDDCEPCNTLRALALPYADHPDFRPEWNVKAGLG